MMRWNRLVLTLLLAAAVAALGIGPCWWYGRGAVVGSAIHHDVSAPLSEVRVDPPTSAAGAEEQWIEMPLEIPPRSSESSEQDSSAQDSSAQDSSAQGSSAQDSAEPPSAAASASLPSVTPPVSLDFEGLSDDDNAAVVGFRLVPPDTQGDIGPNHYVQWINIVFQIWDITRDGDGNPIAATPVFLPPRPGNAIWAGFGGPCEYNNDGDPIVLYDHLADRWLLSQFSVGEGIQCVALSRTPDPAGPYDRWAFHVSPGENNDYPKFGVMPEAYYLSLRDFPTSNGIASAVAFDRADMLAGGAAPTFVKFRLPCLSNDCVDGLQPPHLEGPPPAPGTPGIFSKVWDDDFDGPLKGVDGIRLWEFRPDFDNPWASTFVELPIVPASADFDNNMCGFFNRDCIRQRSSSQRLDPIDELQMYRAQYRHFDSHDSLLVNSTVDSTGTDVAGIYWSEMRNLGGGWVRHQDGTHAPADGENRWMGSIAMDSEGNIALGYSVSSINTDPSIRYVTRESTDAPGTLPGGEVEVIAGGGAQLSSHRWGDYSTMSVDPVADCTFWYTQEYYASTASWDFKTRIAAFKMPNCNGQPPPPPPPPPPLEGDVIVSFSVEAGLLNATLGGEVVRPVDAVDLEAGELVFSAFPDTILEDIDAFHVMPEGEVVFSTSTDVTQGFGGIPYIRNGDLVLWDGEEATLLFSELIGFGSPYNNIDAFSILPNGNWLLSTDLDAILGGLAFQNGDIIEYDPVADVATLYMGLDEATIFTGTPNSNPDIDALHVGAEGKVIFSIRSDGIGRVGNGPTYGFLDAPRTDLFEIDPETLDASLFLDGFGIFDGMTRNLDAVALPGAALNISIVDLEDLGLLPGERIDPPDFVGITSGGFNVDPGPTNQFHDIHVVNSISWFPFNGTTVLGGHDDIVVSPAGGGSFSLIAFDLAGWPVHREVSFSVVANTGATAYFVPDGLVDGEGGVVDFETFFLPGGFEDILSVTFIHTGSGTAQGSFVLDNIVVGVAAGATPSTAPGQHPVEPNAGSEGEAPPQEVDVADP